MKRIAGRKVRARNVDEEMMTLVVSLLDGWSGKLTWDALIQAVMRVNKGTYTRQGLAAHETIQCAFSTAKKRLSNGGIKEAKLNPRLGPELISALQRIERLQAANARLEAHNQRFFEQFARWAYNAQTRGLDEAFLDRPLPPVNRDRTPPGAVRSSNPKAVSKKV